jgi:hypothetical protein
MTKATTAEGDDIRRSLSWVLSRRGILQVKTDSLVCGSWTIPYSEISEAVLFSLRGVVFPGYVLRVKSGNQIYQFGLNPGRFWRGDLPFETRCSVPPFVSFLLDTSSTFCGNGWLRFPNKSGHRKSVFDRQHRFQQYPHQHTQQTDPRRNQISVCDSHEMGWMRVACATRGGELVLEKSNYRVTDWK